MRIKDFTYSESRKLIGEKRFESHLVSFGLKVEIQENETDEEAISKAKALVKAQLQEEVDRNRKENESAGSE